MINITNNDWVVIYDNTITFFFFFCPLYVVQIIKVGHLDIRPSGNPFPKKPPSMRVWVRSLGFSKYTCV
jgi:hypothetical protein